MATIKLEIEIDLDSMVEYANSNDAETTREEYTVWDAAQDVDGILNDWIMSSTYGVTIDYSEDEDENDS